MALLGRHRVPPHACVHPSCTDTCTPMQMTHGLRQTTIPALKGFREIGLKKLYPSDSRRRCLIPFTCEPFLDSR
ncbi:hypothetical protein E2C01_055781 [Portunus trituberculatus]|uniref:Uncharacterized protein n=1 Tax=Portunus trituberculatus TaxID=210409 RepID=A0A5B7GWW8_PORTR|nr:hypothetical protein [Portunus trituberculatus]